MVVGGEKKGLSAKFTNWLIDAQFKGLADVPMSQGALKKNPEF